MGVLYLKKVQMIGFEVGRLGCVVVVRGELRTMCMNPCLQSVSGDGEVIRHERGGSRREIMRSAQDNCL